MRLLKISKQITNRESQSLEKYLQAIGKIGLIMADEEVGLAKRISEGDQIALEKNTRENLRFVVSVTSLLKNYLAWDELDYFAWTIIIETNYKNKAKLIRLHKPSFFIMSIVKRSNLSP